MTKRKYDDETIRKYFKKRINRAALFLGHEIIVACNSIGYGLGFAPWHFQEEAEKIEKELAEIIEKKTNDFLEQKLMAYNFLEIYNG